MSLNEINILIQVVQDCLVLYSKGVSRGYYYYGKSCDTTLGYLCKYPTYLTELEKYKEIDPEYANKVSLYLLENSKIKTEYLKALRIPIERVSIYYGATNTSVVTEGDVLGLINGAIALPNLLTYFTGILGKNQNISIPSIYSISSIIDTDAADSELLPFFSIANVSIFGVAYKVYKMENDVPYLNAHTLNINII